MKLLRPAYLQLLAIAWIAAQSIVCNGQDSRSAAANFRVSVEIESARGVAALLERNQVDEAELSRVAALPGNRDLIRKVARSHKQVTAETFKQTLRGVIEGRDVQPDPFEWQTVKTSLPEIRLMLRRIEQERDTLSAEIEKMIKPFVGEGLNGDAKAVLLVGGGSLGFTLNDSSSFYVALHKIGADYEGLKHIIAHELYHNIQTQGRERRIARLKGVKPPDSVRNSLILLESTYVEGTATLVGSPLEAKDLKNLGESQKEEYKKNLARSRQNFALFESLLFQAHNDPNANVQQLYNIGLTALFEQPLYYVGYQMARDIEKYEGRPAIAALTTKNPLEFFSVYMELYKKKNDPSLLRFSPTTEAILHKLQEWKGKNALIYEGW